MTTGTDMVNAMRTMLTSRDDISPRWSYVVDVEWDPVNKMQYRLSGARHTTDCSGSIFIAARLCGVHLDATVSWTQARYCQASGRFWSSQSDIVTSLSIPGRLLFKGDRMGLDGFGAGGHVAMSVGDGRNVIEAEGSKRDILINPAMGEGHAWSGCGELPGVDYGQGTIPTPGPINLGTDSDEECFMLVQPKAAKVAGRLCTARLNVPGRCVDLFNGAAIAYDLPTSTPNKRQWPIGRDAKHLSPHLNGVPLGMAELLENGKPVGVVVTMSDMGTFIGHYS